MQNLLFGSTLLIMAGISAWYGTNLQFVSEWWKDRPLLTIALFALPTSFFAYFGTKFTYIGLEYSLWGTRLFGYGLSFLVFPILTWYYLGESMFTTKTLTCIFLSMVIMGIQLFWKG